jgi:hypothetical protein
MDMEASIAAAAAFNDVARADGKSTGETICERVHDTLLKNPCRRPMPEQRNGSETPQQN